LGSSCHAVPHIALTTHEMSFKDGPPRNVKYRATLTSLADDEEFRSLLARRKSFKDVSVVGAENEQQIVKYDQSQLSDLLVLLQPWSRGSIFRRTRIWWQIAVYIFLASTTAVLFVRLTRWPARLNPDALSKVSNYFSTFLPFLFGIYLNNIFNRWWGMRTQGVSGIANSLSSMSVIMASQLRGHVKGECKHLLLRYGLLSHELVYRAARGTDAKLADLVEAGTLTPEECGILQDLPSGPIKAQAVWVWIQLLWDGLLEQKAIPWHVHQVVLRIIADGRVAVKSIFTYLNTQIPFAYVHLMACLVHFNLLLLALQSGMIIGKSVGIIREKATSGKLNSADTEATTLLMSQVFYLIMVPMVYLGFLELSQEISDPFGTDLNDFPRAQYHNVMQDENEAFIFMAETVPPSLMPFVYPGIDEDAENDENDDLPGLDKV